jgi:hypothetical protein
VNRLAILAFSISALIPSAHASDNKTIEIISKEDAAMLAKEGIDVIDQLWNEGEMICRTGRYDELSRIFIESLFLIRDLDHERIGREALRPYESCRDAALDVGTLMVLCEGRHSTVNVVDTKRSWLRHSKQCRGASFVK